MGVSKVLLVELSDRPGAHMVVRVQVECLYANKVLVRKVQSLGYVQCKGAILVPVAKEEDCLDYCGHHWLGPRRLDY
jgi:hypothetical protein